jgi:uncharacterized membrane protein YcaP (DUF421 family)
MIQLDPEVLAGIVIRTLAVYFVLLAGLRLAGKRELGQLSVFDLVVILVIANAVQNAMVGPDTSLTGGLVAAITLLIANSLVGTFVARVPWLETRVRGTPSVLINDGQMIEPTLRAEGLTAEEVIMAIREHGIEHVPEVKIAVLEVDGTISVVPRSSHVHRTRRRVRGRKPAG